MEWNGVQLMVVEWFSVHLWMSAIIAFFFDWQVKKKKVISLTKRAGPVFPLLYPGYSIARFHTREHRLILLHCSFNYSWLSIDRTPYGGLSVPFYSVYTHTHSLRLKGSTCSKQDEISINAASNCWFALGAWCFFQKTPVDAISQNKLLNSMLKSFH